MTAEPRRGLVPRDYVARLDALDLDYSVRTAARQLAGALDGANPARFRGKHHRLPPGYDDMYFPEQLDAALAALVEIGYGQTRAERDRSLINHGKKLAERLDKVPLLWPRAIALRYPARDYKHGAGQRRDGEDRWGQIRCNHSPRPIHLAIIGAALGMWKTYAKSYDTCVELTRGELSYMTRAARRSRRGIGGKDTNDIVRALLELDAEVLTGTVKPGKHGERSAQHRIPCSAILLVEARLNDEWVPLKDFDRLCAEAEAQGQPVHRGRGHANTLRIHFADWVIAEARHEKRRLVIGNSAVWRGLTGTAQRLYSFLQGSEPKNGAVAFYLAAPTCFTLGIAGMRPSEARDAVTKALSELYRRDRRYRQGHPRPTKWGTTKFDYFFVRVSDQSVPIPGTRDRPPMARRPACMRDDYCPPSPRPGRVSPYDVRPEDVPVELRKKHGFERARQLVARVRYLAVRDVERAAQGQYSREADNARRRSWHAQVQEAERARLLRVVDDRAPSAPPAAPPPPQRGP